MRFWQRLSQEEKAILLYIQNYEKQNPGQSSETNHIWQGADLEKKNIEIVLKKLLKMKMVTKKPSNKKTEEQRELFGDIYRLTPDGLLYKFTSRWSILTSIGITITTISAIIVMIETTFR